MVSRFYADTHQTTRCCSSQPTQLNMVAITGPCTMTKPVFMFMMTKMLLKVGSQPELNAEVIARGWQINAYVACVSLLLAWQAQACEHHTVISRITCTPWQCTNPILAQHDMVLGCIQHMLVAMYPTNGTCRKGNAQNIKSSTSHNPKMLGISTLAMVQVTTIMMRVKSFPPAANTQIAAL